MLRCRLNMLRWLTWPGARVPLERVTRSAFANHRSSMAAPKAKHLRTPGAGDEAERVMSAGRVGKKGGRGRGLVGERRQGKERSTEFTTLARK